jgi:two-component sensor histidine kinase
MTGPITAAPALFGAGAASQSPDRDDHEPLARHLRMAARPATVPRSRAIVRDLLREWHLEAMSDEAMLLMSELVTNAVQASQNSTGAGQPVVLCTVRRTETALLLEVWDASPAPPVVQEVDLTSDCGRGLLMVEFMSSNWGHRPADGGKVVWAEIPLPG